MMLIQPEKQALSMLEAFEQGVCGSPSILSCHLFSGSVDYLLSLRARSGGLRMDPT
ncbi:MAG TPA: Lrp/AsnC ligand binding domain-containing protein [Croceicoccus sp.]|nr:Lrp/AsnC ligand binding domain-containing protein [Croceicoccus sp.]